MLGQWSVLFPKKVVCYGTVFKHSCMSCQWNSVSSGWSALHDLEHFLLNVRNFLIKELGKGNRTFTVLSLPLQVLQVLPHPGDAFVSSWSNTQVSYVLVLLRLQWIHLISLQQNTTSYNSSGEQTRQTLPALHLLLLGCCFALWLFNLIFLCIHLFRRCSMTGPLTLI